MNEKQNEEECALNEAAQEMKGKEKSDERILNETPTNANKNATTQKCPPNRRRQAAKTSTRLRAQIRGSGHGASRTPLPSIYGRILT
jgi:hypothetical protein